MANNGSKPMYCVPVESSSVPSGREPFSRILRLLFSHDATCASYPIPDPHGSAAAFLCGAMEAPAYVECISKRGLEVNGSPFLYPSGNL